MAYFIPVYEYAKRRGKSSQEIYRLIREHRFKENDVRYEEITKRVLRINPSAKPHSPTKNT